VVDAKQKATRLGGYFTVSLSILNLAELNLYQDLVHDIAYFYAETNAHVISLSAMKVLMIL